MRHKVQTPADSWETTTLLCLFCKTSPQGLTIKVKGGGFRGRGKEKGGREGRQAGKKVEEKEREERRWERKKRRGEGKEGKAFNPYKKLPQSGQSSKMRIN
jgi:hypothetical protein